jgi:hypothetical protein
VSPAEMPQQLSKLVQPREPASGFNIGCPFYNFASPPADEGAERPSLCHLTSETSIDWRPVLRPTDSRAVIGLNQPVKRPSG